MKKKDRETKEYMVGRVQRKEKSMPTKITVTGRTLSRHIF